MKSTFLKEKTKWDIIKSKYRRYFEDPHQFKVKHVRLEIAI